MAKNLLDGRGFKNRWTSYEEGILANYAGPALEYGSVYNTKAAYRSDKDKKTGSGRLDGICWGGVSLDNLKYLGHWLHGQLIYGLRRI